MTPQCSWVLKKKKLCFYFRFLNQAAQQAIRLFVQTAEAFGWNRSPSVCANLFKKKGAFLLKRWRFFRLIFILVTHVCNGSNVFKGRMLEVRDRRSPTELL